MRFASVGFSGAGFLCVQTICREGAEVTGVEGAEDGIDLRESCGEAGAGEEVEAGFVGIGPDGRDIRAREAGFNAIGAPQNKKVYDRKRLKRAGIISDDCPSFLYRVNHS